MATSQYTDACEAYNRAINLNPNDPQIWCSLGVLYYAFGQYREALGMLSRALKLDPSMSDAWYNVGALYDMCDQPEDAQQAYAKAKEHGLADRFSKAGLGGINPLSMQSTSNPSQSGLPSASSAPATNLSTNMVTNGMPSYQQQQTSAISYPSKSFGSSFPGNSYSSMSPGQSQSEPSGQRHPQLHSHQHQNQNQAQFNLHSSIRPTTQQAPHFQSSIASVSHDSRNQSQNGTQIPTQQIPQVQQQQPERIALREFDSRLSNVSNPSH